MRIYGSANSERIDDKGKRKKRKRKLVVRQLGNGQQKLYTNRPFSQGNQDLMPLVPYTSLCAGVLKDQKYAKVGWRTIILLTKGLTCVRHEDSLFMHGLSWPIMWI